MIWKPQELIEKLQKAKDELYVLEKKESKAWRTLAQNKTWYKLFWWIAKHLWNDIQEVKIYFMIGCFWSQKICLSSQEMEIPIISETHKLTKEQWIFLIDTLITFTKIKNIPIEITSAEITNLYDNYN